MAMNLTRQARGRHLLRRVGPWGLASLLLGLTGAGFDRTLTLSLVGAPVPGNGPCGIAIAETSGGTYAVIGDHNGNQVRSLRLDPATGLLTLVGSGSLPNGPTALAATPDGCFVLATTLRDSKVTSYGIDPATGLLTLVGSVSSGGIGPVNLDVSDEGYGVIANNQSNSLGVVRIDPTSGLLTLVGSTTVGRAPNDVKLSEGKVIVGHAISNDVHLLDLDRNGALHPLDVEPVGTSRVTSVDVQGRVAVAGNGAGEVHRFLIGNREMIAVGSHATGGDITDVTLSERGTLFVTGGLPGRVDVFRFYRDQLLPVGALPLPGQLTSRTLEIVPGGNHTQYGLANEFHVNRTLVIKVVNAQ